MQKAGQAAQAGRAKMSHRARAWQAGAIRGLSEIAQAGPSTPREPPLSENCGPYAAAPAARRPGRGIGIGIGDVDGDGHDDLIDAVMLRTVTGARGQRVARSAWGT